MIKEYNFFQSINGKVLSLIFSSIYDVCYFSIIIFFFSLSIFKRAKGDKNSFNNSMKIHILGECCFKARLFSSIKNPIVCSVGPCTVASVSIKVLLQTPSHVSSVCVSWNNLCEWLHYLHILSYGIVRRDY